MRGFDAEHFILSADEMFARMGEVSCGPIGCDIFVTRITTNYSRIFHELFVIQVCKNTNRTNANNCLEASIIVR